MPPFASATGVPETTGALELHEVTRARRVRLLRAIAASFAIVLFGFTVVLAASQAWPAALVSAVALSVTMVIVATASARPRATGWLLLVACWATTSIATLTTGGLGTASIAWLLICPLLGGLTSGRAGAVVGSLLAAGTMLGLVWAHHEGVALPVVFDPEDALAQNLVDAVAAPFCVGLTAWLFLREQRWAETRLLESVETLADEVVVRTEAERRAVLAKKAEQRFLAVASHELRTPLNGVLGITQVLSRRDLGEETNTWIRSLERAGLHLLTLVDQILDFSAHAATERPLVDAPFDLEQLVHDVRTTLAGQAGDEVEVRVEIEPGLETRRVGDRDRVTQIFLNLGGNALKFTAAGEIVLELSHSEADEIDTVRCAVRDTGIGLPTDDIERLFQPFVRDDLTAPAHRGIGLGLAIVKELVVSMGGTIRAESSPGHGACFRFDLPLPVVDTTDDDPVPGLSSPAATGRILVAEDDPLSRTIAVTALESMGWTVTAVGDGAEALDELASGRYDLGLLDGALPRMEGPEIARALRRRGVEIPLVAVTAFAMPGDRERFLEAGVDAYLAKPIRFEELRRVVESLTG